MRGAVSTHKASLWLGMSEESVRRLCRNGKLKGAFQPSGYQGKWLIPVETLEAVRVCPEWLIADLSEVA
jgi:hypothetical protein